MASIEDLVGSAKAQSDLRSNFVRCRYTQAQTVGSGQFFRMTLPKHADQFCDMRSLRLRFNLQVLTGGPGQVAVDAPTVQSIISRIRVLSGSQVLLDIANYNLYAAFEENITVCSTESLRSRPPGRRKRFSIKRGKPSRRPRAHHPTLV